MNKLDTFIDDEILSSNSIHKTHGVNIEVPDQLTCRQCDKTFKPNASTYGRRVVMKSNDFCGPKCRQQYYRGKR